MPEDMVRIEKQPGSELLGTRGGGYPHGTRLSLDKELIDKLGLDSLELNDLVEVRGLAFVDRKSEHKTQDHSDKNIGIQLTDIKVKRKESDRVEQLYGSRP
jgi:hypothetical protein